MTLGSPFLMRSSCAQARVGQEHLARRPYEYPRFEDAARMLRAHPFCELDVRVRYMYFGIMFHDITYQDTGHVCTSHA